MTGDDVIRRLHADPATATIPIVILSADATQRQISHLLATGATTYLTKPIAVRHLLQTIDNTCGEPQPPVSGEEEQEAQ